MEPRDAKVEQALRRYRPVGPPADLRARVLAAAQAEAARPAPRRIVDRIGPFWWSMAAMLVVAVALQWASRGLTRQICGSIGIGPAAWTSSADEAVELLGDDAAARRYVMAGLSTTGA